MYNLYTYTLHVESTIFPLRSMYIFTSGRTHQLVLRMISFRFHVSLFVCLS